MNEPGLAVRYPAAAEPLQAWRKIVESRRFANVGDLKEAFAATDKVGSFYVFNIGGNKHPIGNRAEYRRATSALNQLLDAGAADENHELAPLVTLLGMLIEAYENRAAVNDKPSPAAVLKLLMEQHELTQSELPEIGSQGVVSEILRGKRHLNVRQVKALSERFHVPADVFI